MPQTTYMAKKGEIKPRWHLLDLNDVPLGRAATRIADTLRGKNKPQFTPHTDTGDFVVAVNASKVKLTGNKKEDKEYFRHSGYPGGIKSVSAGKLLVTHPDRIIKTAVKGMLPKNILGRHLLKKLKVYAKTEHPHAAQKPVEMKI
ncbi:MAG: 50S ribosomal protein L13 [Deltaproteobacteria bacterium]|nr:50S ribosomal protein L13 [Deltaproteobacteria bacterium]